MTLARWFLYQIESPRQRLHREHAEARTRKCAEYFARERKRSSLSEESTCGRQEKESGTSGSDTTDRHEGVLGKIFHVGGWRA